jgi:hypothetical protein
LIDKSTARITALAKGTIVAPERALDLSLMVDAIQVRALEIELAKLEQLRQEQEDRSKAAAERRAMLMELEAQRLQAEADRLAAEADQLAADEEAARLAEEALHPPEDPTDPIDPVVPVIPADPGVDSLVDPLAGDQQSIDLILQDSQLLNPPIDQPVTDLMSGQ